MAKKIYVDKSDEDYIPESGDELTFETDEGINDAKIVVDAKAVSAKDQRYYATQLEGTPKRFPYEASYVLRSLRDIGVAAEFNEGWARGHKWREFMRG